jgi:uncharacterized protein (DUF362 family)
MSTVFPDHGLVLGQRPAVARAVAPPSRVALWRGPERATALRAALDAVLGEVDWATRERVVVKPNVVDPRRPLAVTHPDALAAVLGAIRARYGGPLAVAEGCGVLPTMRAFAMLGYPAVALAHDADLVDLNADDVVPARVFDKHGRPLAVRLARTWVESDCRVSLAVPKTHDNVLVTLTIKNAVMGALIDRRQLLPGRSARWRGRLEGAFLGNGNGHGSDKVALHQGYPAIHLDLALLATRTLPHLAVLDGCVAMEGNGPIDGTPVPWGIALAGTDAVAVDALAAWLMGLEPGDVGYLRYAADLGLGCGDPLAVDVVGNVPPEEVRRTFHRHPAAAAQRTWRVDDAAERLARGLALVDPGP